jgi:hypothetical protein
MKVPVASDFLVPFVNNLDSFADFNILRTSAQGERNCGIRPDLGTPPSGEVTRTCIPAFFRGKKEKPDDPQRSTPVVQP